MWRDALLTCFTRNTDTDPYTLQTMLGAWYWDVIRASAFYSPHRNTVYQLLSSGRYRRYTRSNDQPSRQPFFIRQQDESNTLPADAIPTTIKGNHHNCIQYTGISTIIPIPKPVEEAWWGIVVEHTLPIPLLVQAIQQGTAIALMDGSFKDQFGTAAFSFRASLNDTRIISLVNMTPGMAHEITPYRVELGGLYEIAAFLHRLQLSFPISGTITVACDCLGAINQLTHNFPPKPNLHDADMLWEIHHMRATTSINWTLHWVKGHQDSLNLRRPLDAWARLNIAMDNLAKSHWHRLQSNPPRPFSLPPSVSIWSIWQRGIRISSWDKSSSDQVYYALQELTGRKNTLTFPISTILQSAPHTRAYPFILKSEFQNGLADDFRFVPPSGRGSLKPSLSAHDGDLT